jgi:hypothetical protein
MFEIMNTLHQKICEIYAYFGIHWAYFIESITKLLEEEDRLSYDDKMQILTLTIHHLWNSPKS